MPAPVFFADALAGAALSRLRAGTAAGHPLAGVYVPDTRHQQVPAGTLKALFCYASSERGQGVGRSLPQLSLTDTLHIDGFVAQGRESPTDLDQAVGTLVQAVLDLLLQDTTFLALFGWVDGVNVEKQDVVTGKDAEEYDIVEFRIELELGGGETTYTPVYTTPLQIIDVKTTVGDVTIEAEINLPQE
jgi:hypothetical protein